MMYLPYPLLSKEKDRVVRRPLCRWVTELERSLNSLTCPEDSYASMAPLSSTSAQKTPASAPYIAEKLAAIFNQICLIFFYANAPGRALDGCFFLLKMLRRLHFIHGDARYVELLVQPLINLARLYSFSGDCPKSLYVYKKLALLETGRFLLNGKKIGSEALSAPTQNVLRYVGYYEPIKALILNKKFEELDQHTRALETYPEFTTLWYECAILLALYRGNSKEALDLCRRGFHAQEEMRHLFSLKISHIFQSAGDSAQAIQSLAILMRPYVEEKPLLNYAGLSFCYDVIKSTSLLMRQQDQTLWIHFLEYVYEQAQEFDDEMIKIESLRCLEPYREFYKKELKNTVESTQYHLLLKRKHRPFAPLDHLNTKVRNVFLSLEKKAC